MEAHVLAAIRRRYGVKLPKVRRALDYVRHEFHIERPLIDRAFQTDGLDLFVERYGQMINASREGQQAMAKWLPGVGPRRAETKANLGSAIIEDLAGVGTESRRLSKSGALFRWRFRFVPPTCSASTSGLFGRWTPIDNLARPGVKQFGFFPPSPAHCPWRSAPERRLEGIPLWPPLLPYPLFQAVAA